MTATPARDSRLPLVALGYLVLALIVTWPLALGLAREIAVAQRHADPATALERVDALRVRALQGSPEVRATFHTARPRKSRTEALGRSRA